jgi:hypothetical protein
VLGLLVSTDLTSLLLLLLLYALTRLCCMAQVGPSCIMGEECVVGDKTSVKRSVIGSNCRCVTRRSVECS